MPKIRTLADKTLLAKRAGHSGLFRSADLALLTDSLPDKNFKKFLSKAVKTGVLEKVFRDIFINPLSPPENKGILAHIAKMLHWNKFIYISMESQLSYLGEISQVTMNNLTLMTTGRSGIFKTKYGTVEFTHSRRSIASIQNDVYYDSEIQMFRATKEKAIKDLKRVGRNLDMLEGESDA